MSETKSSKANGPKQPVEKRVNILTACDLMGLSGIDKSFAIKFYGDKTMAMSSWVKELKGKI